MNIFHIIFLYILLFSNLLYGQSIDLSSINISIGFGGFVIPNQWTPVRITSDKSILDPLAVEVIRQDIDGYALPPEIFIFSGNKLEASFFSNESSVFIKVRILEGSRIIKEETINTRGNLFPGHLILTGQLSSGVQQAVRQIKYPAEPVVTIPVEINDLPYLPLNYDGVSCIIIEDPGLILNPGQTDAIKQWLSGGGRLILYSLKSFSESIVSSLADINELISTGELIQIKTGMGNIKLLSEDINKISEAGNPSFWRKIIDLKTYRTESRITASRCFPIIKEIPKNINYTKIRLMLLLFFMIWLFCMFIIIIFIKKNLWIFLIGMTVIFSIISAPFAVHNRKIWQRGATVHTRGVILPDNTGIFLNTLIQASPAFFWSPVSPWEIKARLGLKSTANIYPGRDAKWIHHTEASTFNLRNGNLKSLELIGYIPMQKNPGLIIGNGNDNNKFLKITSERLIWKDNKLWSFTINDTHNFLLQEKKDIPEWSKNDISWLAWLSEHFPDISWMIGTGTLFDLNLEILDNSQSGIFWIYPLTFSILK